MNKELEVDLNRKEETEIVEMTRVALKPGDTLMVKFKSDYIDEYTLNKFRDSLKERFPDNDVAIFQVNTEDDIVFSVIGKE